jgi:pimeloyl-ACP methyl ester carboxylesterase
MEYPRRRGHHNPLLDRGTRAMKFATVAAPRAQTRSGGLRLVVVSTFLAFCGRASAEGEGAGQVTRDTSSALRFVVPYQAGKVPVVFVHGMFGSPGNWSAAIRKLSDDPDVRDHFQFLTFSYESLRPIPDSGLRLSEALNEARRSVDPRARDRSFDQVVLIGHSLGGLVVKAASHAPDPARIPLDSQSVPSERLAARVSRVVFIATPHRGSPVDQGAARCAGLWLARTLGASSQGEGARASSVVQLTWDNPLLLELERARRAQSLPFHSIIAAVGDPSADGATDGLVPVPSARLRGARSEMVVRAHHMCIQHSDVIREVRRILIEHAAPPGLPTVGVSPREDELVELLARQEPRRDAGVGRRPSGPTSELAEEARASKIGPDKPAPGPEKSARAVTSFTPVQINK